MGFFGKRDKTDAKRRAAADMAGAAHPLALALEPRFMFDAAGAATGSEIAEQTAADSLADDTAVADDNETARRELVVVDTSVAGYSTLIAGLDPGVDVLEIGADEAGFQALADALTGRAPYDSIQILSHGGEGAVQLGTDLLTSQNLSAYGDALSAIGAALTPDGDLLLYGCEVGTGTGWAFVDELALVTGADVAASDDFTGSSDLGG
ncbi:MAG: DUF4347 domain-containing protein, partial [Rhodospirillales bacterium]|nr:DUF4347 domain-containing protein [Rhodospirillales bacterium]